MAYTVDITIGLGSSMTGAALAAQLIDSSGVNQTGLITSGFVELGGGNYLWHYAAYPDGFRGAVKFYDTAHPGDPPIAATDINPELYQQQAGSISITSGHSQSPDIGTGSGPSSQGGGVWVTPGVLSVGGGDGGVQISGGVRSSVSRGASISGGTSSGIEGGISITTGVRRS